MNKSSLRKRRSYGSETDVRPIIQWLSLASREPVADTAVKRVRRLLVLMQRIEVFHERAEKAVASGKIERMNRMRMAAAGGFRARRLRNADVLDGEFEIQKIMRHYSLVPDMWARKLRAKEHGLIVQDGTYYPGGMPVLRSEGEAVARIMVLMERRELWRVGFCEQCGEGYYVKMRGKKKQARFCKDACRAAFHSSTPEGRERNRKAQARFRASQNENIARQKEYQSRLRTR